MECIRSDEGRDRQTESFANARGRVEEGENTKSVQEIHSPSIVKEANAHNYTILGQRAWAFNLPKS